MKIPRWFKLYPKYRIELDEVKSIPIRKDNLEICLWYQTGDCNKSGIREFVKKEIYDGKHCKCYAYIPSTEKVK